MNPRFNRKVGTEIILLPQKKEQVLPENVSALLKELDTLTPQKNIVRNAYVCALRHAGWTLQAIADGLGVSRERVRQIENATPASLVAEISIFTNEFPVPAVPSIAIEKDVYELIVPSDETLARLKELQPLAQQVRSHSPKYRAEAEEYSALLWKAHTEEGVTLYRIAKCLGVTHGALRFRLARYGYLSPSHGGTSKVYRKILDKNRVSHG